MKNRPLKHKANNAFKFKSFNDRISEIDIRKSALYHVEYECFSCNDNQSNFYQTIQKWSVLNLTEEYVKFHQKVRDVITLPQLLHRKEFVLEHLYECLEEATNLSLQPLLEILVVLAKDLREEFYPYFIKFFQKLVCLLRTRDPDQLEWTIISLAFLFKLLKGFLRKDISLLFNEIIKLIDNKQPLHITNFATECFSFVVRDIRNKKNMILLIVASVKENSSIVMGCGRILFEIIRGVNHQFHNCAEDFLMLMFEFLNETQSEDVKYFVHVLVQMVTDMLQIISVQNIEPFWKISISCLDKFLDSKPLNENCIQHMVYIMGLVIEFKQGSYTTNSSTIIQKLIKIMDTVKSENTILNVMQISTSMILSKKNYLPQLDASRLSKKIMSISEEYPNVFMQFIRCTLEYSQFEILIYHDFIKFFEKKIDSERLELLTEIVVKKSPICKNGIDLDNWKRFNVTLKRESSEEKFRHILEMPVEKILNNITEFTQTVIILPHLTNFHNNTDIYDSLQIMLNELFEKMAKLSKKTDNLDQHFSTIHLLILILIETLIHTNVDCKIVLANIQHILPYCDKEDYMYLLNTLDLCLSYLHKRNKNALDDSLFIKIHDVLKHNLCSHHHNVRKLTTHVFTLFNHLENLKIEDDAMTLFDVLYRIECIEPTITNYRDQIMLIQKLGYETIFFQNIKENYLKIDALRYVSSLYFINFNLLWEPTNDIIQTYSENMIINDFWEIYKRQIEYSSKMDLNKHENNKPLVNISSPLINEYWTSLWRTDDKIDFINYRWLLLKYLSNYKRVFETRNRDVVELFFEFVQNEYHYKNDLEQNEENNENDSKMPKGTQKFLIVFLRLLSNMNNPKAIYRSSDLYNLYLKLLSHRNFEVQKLALDCIILYKEPHLTPYKIILHKIINDATIKDCLMSFFKLNHENRKYECEIQTEHRPLFIPYIIEILYTKLTMKSTKPEIKPIILRFIGKLDENEILLFTKKMFEFFENILKDNPLDTFNFIINENNKFSFEAELPSNKLQGIMQMLELVKAEVAGLKSEKFTKYLLHIMLCIDSILLRLQASNYKPLKSKGLLNLVDFFIHFDKYRWCEEEIDAIFNIHIWPTLEKLPYECIHQPTPLLKLFNAWSQNPKYYNLFSKFKEGQQYLTPLPYIMQLLNGKQTSANVSNTILEMISKMLSLQNEARFDQIPIKNHVKVDIKVIKEKNMNFGSGLLLPYLPEILQYYKTEMKSKKIIGKNNLLILSRITDIVNDPETCRILMNVIVPITMKRIENSTIEHDTIQDMLTTILSLIRQVLEPQIYIRKLAPLFQRITELKTRKILIDILEVVANKSEDLKYKQIYEILRDMNAMHRKWLEQPDYEKRLNAFKTVNVLTERNEIKMDLGVLFVHQCYYYLKTDKDLAIRDNSRHQMRKVCIGIIKSTRKTPDDHNYFIEKIVLPAILKGVKDKNLEAKNESITLLGELSRDCTEDHRIFKDLSNFSCSRNRDVDFFDNMTHLQIYKHRKAMNRFVKIAENLTEPLLSQSLMNFIYPIVSTYLCNEQFKKKSKITESAINCIGIMCRKISWHHYRFILKSYLEKLKRNVEYQKQITKLIGLVLDAFHFDLANADVNDNIIEKNIPKEEIDNSCKRDEILDENIEIVEDKVSNALNKENANKIVFDISKVIIPELFRAINFNSTSNSIKSLEKKERFAREKEEMAKIPIAIAIVKLLQKLPKDVMESKLPKLILKITNFLKSQMKQVRALAKDTLKSMLESLGIDYFSMLLDNLQAVLRKGFQVHVLTVTIHTLLDAIKDQLNPTNIEPILQTIMKICIDDIFGRVAEEKEINALTRKTPEAKPSRKSFLTLNILAKNIDEKSIIDLILPFNEILTKTHSRKNVLKVQEAFHKIAEGLTTNNNLSIESILVLTFGITSESIPELFEQKKTREPSEEIVRKTKVDTPDIYLIQSEPKRRGAYNQLENTTSSKTNTHIVLELGLEIINITIKRNQLQISNFQTYLEPIIPILRKSLTSKHMKVVILSLRCLTSIWSARLEMDIIKENLEGIVEEVFKILHKYATAGIMRMDDNFHLVKCAFKALVTLLRYTTYFKFSNDQLKVLLLYVEQDLYNVDKQAMAFILLRSIVGKKLVAQEINDIMKKVAEICINAELDRVREEARIVFLEYLIDYPLGKKIDAHLNFIINQLEYSMLSGRESAVQTLVQIFTKFPEEILNNKAGFFFLSIGVRLVNEESTELRQKIAESIELLLKRIDKNVKNELFELILAMITDSKLSHKEMSAQLCMRFLNIEKKLFNERLEKIFPCLINVLTNVDTDIAGKFVKLINNDESNEENMDGKNRARDHVLIQTLVAIGKIFQNCPSVLIEKQFSSYVGELGYTLQLLLAHDHLWIRQECLNLIGALLKTTNFDMIHKIIGGECFMELPREFIYSNPLNDLKSLTIDMCSQLIPGESNDEIVSKTIQNLLFIANIIKVIPLKYSEKTDDDYEEENNSKNHINLHWLLRRIRYVIHGEVTKAPTCFTIRKYALNWLEALITLIEDDKIISNLAASLLSPLVREMNDEDHVKTSIKQKASNLCDLIKSRIGEGEYDRLLLELKEKLLKRRIDRKKHSLILKVNNPVDAAKKKIALQQKKKENRIKKRRRETTYSGIDNTGKSRNHKRKRMEDLFS